MIIEGLVTTCDSNGQPHVAPMGPVVSEDLQEWTLRPFKTSNTFKNLRAHPVCVFHVMDDVLPLTNLVLKQNPGLTFERLQSNRDNAPDTAWLVKESCRWFLLDVQTWNIASDRSEAEAQLWDQGELRPFWGWNRAKHAVLEAAILMTRLHILKLDEVERSFAELAVTVDKTAGNRERHAWQLLVEHLAAAKGAV